MNIITVSSFTELQEALFTNSWNENLGRFRTQFAYRGLSDQSYRLETTLIRLGGKYAELEKHLLRNFRKYAHRTVVERDNLWHWLTVAQHYGLPTRLLDWTHSPFIAMHFATSNLEKFNLDGAIWMVNYAKAHLELPDQLRAPLEIEGANVLTVDMMYKTVENLEEFARLRDTDFVAFLEPPSIDDRIVNQFALFSFLSTPTGVLDNWLENHPDMWYKIIIPADLKWEIRDKLDQANITERVLFPGLEGLSRWLRRHYSPRS